MYTILFSAYAEPSLSRDELVELWTVRHANIAKRLPKLRSYEIFIVDEVVEADDPKPDGWAIIRFDSKDDADAALATPLMQESIADTKDGLFTRFETFVVDRHVALDEQATAGSLGTPNS